MKIKTALISTALFTSMFIAGAASASPGYVSRNVNLRAGPDVRYPVVERVRAGTRVEIFGCLDQWDWCEVGSRNDRGWVSGSYLQAIQHNRRVYIGHAGPVIGFPVISFEVGNYWDEHYRNKPFYHDRVKWAHDDRRPPMRDNRNDNDHHDARDNRDDNHDGQNDQNRRDYPSKHDNKNNRH